MKAFMTTNDRRDSTDRSRRIGRGYRVQSTDGRKTRLSAEFTCLLKAVQPLVVVRRTYVALRERNLIKCLDIPNVPSDVSGSERDHSQITQCLFHMASVWVIS